ncbi:hypothetical protein CDAR_253561 [Caerostris darwini]|uniref:Uncharacterized protein n=1 Tax=Caerostris darwini TaxID=1538125 RepID=A0AAV4Q2S5_9ARAC|nr:hypothetical protein CDAR_253561 [Caerostris darwini]
MSSEDDKRSGRPKEAVTDENIKKSPKERSPLFCHRSEMEIHISQNKIFPASFSLQGRRFKWKKTRHIALTFSMKMHVGIGLYSGFILGCRGF